jgi:hypothetical protein
MAKYNRDRRDTNQKKIMENLRTCGIGCKDVSMVAGFCDLIVIHHGLYLFELKNPEYVKKRSKYRDSLTDAERVFHNYAYRHGVKVHIVTTFEEIISILNADRAA